MGLKYIVVAVVAIAITAFALQNNTPTAVRFLFWNLPGVPLATIILVSVTLGVVLVGVPLLIGRWRLRLRLRSLEARVGTTETRDGERDRASGSSQSSPPQVLRIGETDYIALGGCMAAACATRRALVLVSADGERLLARVDDGGLTHLYAFGPGMITLTPEDRLVVEAAWRALQPH